MRNEFSAGNVSLPGLDADRDRPRESVPSVCVKFDLVNTLTYLLFTKQPCVTQNATIMIKTYNLIVPISKDDQRKISDWSVLLQKLKRLR